MPRETNQKERETNQKNASTASNRESSSTAAQTSQQADRERSISTGREGARESRGTAMSRQGTTSPGRAGGNPLMLMQRMAEDMDRLFEQFGIGRTGFSLTPSVGSLLDQDLWSDRPSLVGTDQTLWSPQIELFQRGDDLVVRADLPGVKRDDLHVEVQNDVLTLSGERREEHDETGEGFYRSERSYGRFYRALPLPDGVNADLVNATFNDGVLEVTLPAPKQQGNKAKRIEIR
jgi:HSP20 family protein